MLFLAKDADKSSPKMFVVTNGSVTDNLPEHVSFTIHPVEGPFELTALVHLISRMRDNILDGTDNTELILEAATIIEGYKSLPSDGRVTKQKQFADVKFWTLTIDDDAGLDTKIYTCEEAAQKAFASCIDDDWADHMDEEPQPEDPHDAYDRLRDQVGFMNSYALEERSMTLPLA